ncbi:MAG: virulence factor [Spirochaetaceae bacterium]|nr:virulence factor [Spirochaetaceae bacterium]
MAEYKVLAWRGIPAQVKAYGAGGTQSATMPDRYQTEIDRVAMREGLAGTDAYLDQWKWGPRISREGSAKEVLDAVIAELVAEWDPKLTSVPGARAGDR